MAENIKRHLSHLKSSGGTSPSASQLVYGEIAVGYLKDSEALYIKNSSGEVVTFTTAAGGEAMAEDYTDKRVITKVTGDSEITVSLSASGDTSGRTLTVTHASGSAQSGFKKLASDSYGHITGGSDVALSDLTNLGAVSSARTITTASGLTGGGNLSADRTIGLATTGTAGTYYQVKTDKYGRVTSGKTSLAESDVTNLTTDLAAKVGTGRTITTASGLTGGGNLSTDLTIGHSNNITAGTAKGSSGSIAHGGTIDIPSITYDANGHITASGKTTVTLPGNDNYITGVTASASGINVSVTSGVLTVGHSNSITAGSAKTSSTSVTATPSGANIAIPVIEYDARGHVKSTGSTNVSLKVNTAATGTAGVVKIATTTGTNNSDTVMTQSAVTKAIEDSFAEQDAMVYKGLVGSGTNYGFPTTFNKGYTYKVATAFTADSVAYEIGDMFIANTDVTTAENYTKAHWDAIQTNLDPTLYVNTATTVTGTNGLTGGGALSSNVTISHATAFTASGQTSPNAAQTPSFNETFNVPVIQYDKYGHITGATTTTVKIPNSASTWTNNYYTSGLTVSTATTSNTITVKGTNSAVTGTAVLSGATTSAAGLMSKDDKVKLNSVHSGATKVEFTQTNTSGDKIGEIKINDGTAVALYADNQSLAINGGSNTATTAVSYNPTTAKTLTISGSASSGGTASSAISVVGEDNKLTIHLNDIVCGDYA